MSHRPAAPTADREQDPLAIVVGFDLSAQSELALEEAIVLGTRSGLAVIHVLGVLGRGGRALGDSREVLDTAGDATLEMQGAIAEEVESTLARCGSSAVRVFVHVRPGSPADELLSLASEVRAGLIIVGSHNRTGVQRLLLGSVAEKVMREARCPVLVMRPSQYESDREVLPDAPCPACITRRVETAGAEWWCSTHAKPWIQPHRYAYTDAGIARMRPDDWALW